MKVGDGGKFAEPMTGRVLNVTAMVLILMLMLTLVLTLVLLVT